MLEMPKEESWYFMWETNRKNAIEQMEQNVIADLESGFSPSGYYMILQLEGIKKCREEFERTCSLLEGLSRELVERWCFYALKGETYEPEM